MLLSYSLIIVQILYWCFFSVYNTIIYSQKKGHIFYGDTFCVASGDVVDCYKSWPWIWFADSAFTDYMKGLSPASLDMELRLLQIIDDEESEDLEQRPELQSISSLLDYFIHELSCRNNFEFVQAILKLFLKVCDMFILQAGPKVFSEACAYLNLSSLYLEIYIFLGSRYMVKQYGDTQLFRAK